MRIVAFIEEPRVVRAIPEHLSLGLWARISGEPVVERGLFFTAANHYEVL